MLCDDERPELKEIYGDCAATFKAWNSESLSRESALVAVARLISGGMGGGAA
jgi:hypothetical protein